MICGCLDLAEEFILKLIKYAFLVAVYFNDKKKYYIIQYKIYFDPFCW